MMSLVRIELVTGDTRQVAESVRRALRARPDPGDA
jgi:hypothetical protein